MKVEQKEEGFKTVTITLETEEEARQLWHRLNCNKNKTLSDYAKEEQEHFSDEMQPLDILKLFSPLNSVYTPKRS